MRARLPPIRQLQLTYYPGYPGVQRFLPPFVGLALASVVSVAPGAAVERKANTTILFGVGALGFTLSTVGLTLHLYSSLINESVGINESAGLSGMLFGGGVLLIALVWTDYCSVKPFAGAFRLGAKSLFVSHRVSRSPHFMRCWA